MHSLDWSFLRESSLASSRIRAATVSGESLAMCQHNCIVSIHWADKFKSLMHQDAKPLKLLSILLVKREICFSNKFIIRRHTLSACIATLLCTGSLSLKLAIQTTKIRKCRAIGTWTLSAAVDYF